MASTHPIDGDQIHGVQLVEVEGLVIVAGLILGFGAVSKIADVFRTVTVSGLISRPGSTATSGCQFRSPEGYGAPPEREEAPGGQINDKRRAFATDAGEGQYRHRTIATAKNVRSVGLWMSDQ